MKSWTFTSALERMKKYCALHEQCTHKVRLKLRQLQIPSEWHEKIILELTRLDYLNDERYAQHYFQYRLSHHVTPRMIVAELRSFQIDEHIIASILQANLEWNEKDQLKTFLKKQLRKYDHLPSDKLKFKLIRDALRKGYDMETITQVITCIIAKKED